MRSQLKNSALGLCVLSLLCSANAVALTLEDVTGSISAPKMADLTRSPNDTAATQNLKNTDDANPKPSKPYLAPKLVDEGALRYFAQHHQMDRVKIELERLQKLNPGYTQPKDLFRPVADSGGPEDQPLWDLFGANKLDELRAQIAARKALDPSWLPPNLLLSRLAQKQARLKLMALYATGKWGQLLLLAKSDPKLIDTHDLDLMWTLAASYAKAHQSKQALAVYQNILQSEKDPQKRLATLQKAMTNLRMARVETLYAMGVVDSDGHNEFDVIKIDLTRARISAFLHDERGGDIDSNDLASFALYAKGDKDANQAGLVGWYSYKKRDYAEALVWFKLAIANKGDATIAHGLALTLDKLGQFRDAEEVAFAWSHYDMSNAILFTDLLARQLTKPIPPYIDNNRLSRFAQITADTGSGEGAQGLAWYAYNSCQYPVALQWFQRAAAWFPKEATIKGLALTYLRLGDRAHFMEIVNRYDGLFPTVVGLVFPTDHYTAPPPCEQTVEAPMAAYVMPAPTLQLASATSTDASTISTATIAYPIGMAPNYPGSLHDPLRRYSWGIVPSPTGEPAHLLPANYHGEAWHEPTFDPFVLPQMVDPQNPLRMASIGQALTDAPPATAFAPALVSNFAAEPFVGPWPLLARKVFGAPVMPYQTNGYILMKYRESDPTHKGEWRENLRFVPPKPMTDANIMNDPRVSDAPIMQPLERFSPSHPTNVAPSIPAPTKLQQKISFSLPTSTLALPVEAAAPQPFRTPIAAAPQPSSTPTNAPSSAHNYAPKTRGHQHKANFQAHVFGKQGRACAFQGQNTPGLADGWCLMNMQRPQEASLAFDRASSHRTSGAAYGKAMASLSSGLLNTAVEIEASGALSGKQKFDIQTGILALKATNLYKQMHFRQTLATLDQRRALTPETRDLSILRGWSYYNLVRLDEAKRIFEALDRQMSTPDSQRGLGEVNSRLASGTH